MFDRALSGTVLSAISHHFTGKGLEWRVLCFKGKGVLESGVFVCGCASERFGYHVHTCMAVYVCLLNINDVYLYLYLHVRDTWGKGEAAYSDGPFGSPW